VIGGKNDFGISLFTSLIVLACILGGAGLGIILRNRLPDAHLSGTTKDVIRAGTALISTIAALVLGLLIASANTAYQSQSSQIQQLTANIIVLDKTLAQYGPGADLARNLLRRSVNSLVDRIWNENGSYSRRGQPFEASPSALSFYDEILKLSPTNDAQRSVQNRAISIAQDLAKTRLLLFAQAGASIPVPFLVVLVSWLAVIFASFSLFSDNNATAIVAIGIFALSASTSIFLILELSQPFAGLMMIPSEPLRNALAPLGP
jgi:hypothetical protein